MKKLVNGILEFRRKLQPSQKVTFAQLALGQKPDALYIGCSDSRVAVNVFASTDPGDLFVNRNVGNIIPPVVNGKNSADGVWAAIEFAVMNLQVRHIIVCGHSECGAMLAMVRGVQNIESEAVKCWLEHGAEDLQALEANASFAPHLTPHNRLSQLNVLKQVSRLKSHPLIQERIQARQLNIHGWWFDIANAEVSAFDEAKNKFVVIDETEGARILNHNEALSAQT